MDEPKDQQAPGPHNQRHPIDDAAQDWFLLLTSGAPTEDDRVRFDVWRAADPRHNEAYDELCTLWNDIDGLRDAFAPPGASLRTQPVAEEKAASPAAPTLPQRKKGFYVNRRHVIWGTLAAACVVLFLAVTPDIAMHLLADHKTAVGKQAHIALPDGSIAWLNTNTAIAVEYAEGRRQISLLQGEAQFQVAKDAARPFAVMARKGQTTALGTLFMIHAEQTRVAVTVSEGTVEVASPVGGSGAQAAQAETAIVGAGQQVRYREGAAPGRAHDVDAAAATAWRDGFIAIKNLPLTDALAEIDRYRPGRIVLLANTDELEPVTARLSIAAIDNGLAALAATQGLTLTRLTDYLVLVR